ncbi:MAG: type II secretion system major pseudopilin GspG [Maricaulaceae bacterium]|jgi:general secretion pathway protein G
MHCIAQSERQAKARTSQEGFTLTEVMVTILIIGLLSTVVLINVLPSRDQAMVEKARADIRTLEMALDMYRADMLVYPSTEENLDALVAAPAGHPRAERFREDGYIRRLPADPWGNPYQYVSPGESRAFDVYSLGADGRLGGEGLDQDIGNWS